MSCNTDPTDCDAWSSRADHDPPRFNADPDIAGVGVVLAFIATASLTLIVALFQLVLDPPWKKRSPVNFIDRCIARVCSRYLRLDLSRSWFTKSGDQAEEQAVKKRWGTIAQRLLVNLSDQQLVLSVAMIIAALALQSEISVYHYTIVNDLLWFSMDVNTQSMVSSRYWMRGNPRSRNWRFALMSATPAFIVLSQVRGARLDWVDGYPYDLRCLLEDPGPGPENAAPWWFSINIIFILFRYTITYIKMFNAAESLTINRLYTRPRQWFEQNTGALGRFKGVYKILHLVKVSFFVIIFGPMVSIALFADSDCILLAQNLSWFNYGLMLLVKDRNRAAGRYQSGDESQFGFGQIVPLVLLATTPFTLGEVIYGRTCY